MKPGISCIHQDSTAIGTKAVEILLDKLNSKTEADPRLIEILTTDKIRGSY